MSKKTKMWIIGGGVVLSVVLVVAIVVFFKIYPGGIPELINEIEVDSSMNSVCKEEGYESYGGVTDDWNKTHEIYCEKDGKKYRVYYTPVAAKPMIYLYPRTKTEVTVKLEKPEKLTTVYPEYENEWKVVAEPSGKLVDKSGREYYGLYWEGKDWSYGETDEGFIVKGEDTATFLEEKLSILGLNEREAEEFIVYWLPKMSKNRYNYVRFATSEEIDEYMPLSVSPKPDTTIRIVMIMKKMDQPKQLKGQVLDSVKRNGFTVVEWGGIDLNQ